MGIEAHDVHNKVRDYCERKRVSDSTASVGLHSAEGVCR